MKEKLKHLIAEHVIRKGELKLALRNLQAVGALTEFRQNQILDELQRLDHSITKLTEIIKVLEG